MKIEELEIKLQNFKDEQQQQKLRGLNNYNIMEVLRKRHAEVGMHSNFIYSLIDINGDHYQGDLFAKLFVERVLKIDDFGKLKEVEKEVDAGGRRIDFTIKSDSYYIGIEMKIYADDQNKQIYEYHKCLREKADYDKKQNVKIYYLTLDGKNASEKSLNGLSGDDYRTISFKKDILNWLEECQKQVSNITNLNNAIGYYTDVVNKLVGKYKSPIKEYKDFFLNQEIYECYKENENHFNGDLSIADGFKKAKQKLYNAFYKRIVSQIIKQNDNIIFDHYDIENKKIVLNIYSYYEIWIILSDNAFKSIGIRPAYNIQWQGNDTLKVNLENAKKFLSSNSSLRDYVIGKKKGVNSSSKFMFYQDTVPHLFSLYENKNKVEQLDDKIIEEVQKLIAIIQEELNNSQKI